jgi:hypothetical protein
MVRDWLHEALIDLQTIIIVGLLYALLREEQANAFLRTWLSENFPLGLYLLNPLTVAAISGALMAVTIVRIALFVTGWKVALGGRLALRRPHESKYRLRVLPSSRGTNPLALVLASFGTVLTLYSYFAVNLIPLVALGISCIVLGFTAASLPRRTSGGSGMRAMLQGATLGVEALLDQSPGRRATYLPPSDGGIVTAYIPLTSGTEIPSLSEMRQAPKSRVAENQKDVLVYPIGSELSKIPEFQDGFSLEEGLRYILVESANICSRVMAEDTGSLIIVGMNGADVTIQGKRYLDSLGSLPSSLAACVIATLHNKPVTLLEERTTSDRLIAIFRLLA